MNAREPYGVPGGTVTKPLDFLVIGGQKCATTWLHDCLSEHPEVGMPRRKLEAEYLGGDLYEKHGAAWYFAQFPYSPDAKVRGHVSVEYLTDPRSPDAVRRHLPDTKVIVSLRDPVDRATSAFHWHVRKGALAPISLDEAMRMALDHADDDIHVDSPYADVLERGLYGKHLGRYLDVFPSDRFLYLDFNEIATRPKAVLARLFGFLEVDVDHIPPSIGTKPKHNSHASSLAMLQRLAPGSRFVGKLMDLAHQAVHALDRDRPAPELDPGLRNELRGFFAEDLRTLQRHLSNADTTRVSPSLLQPNSWTTG